jgi:hypothetical protein
MQAYKSCSIDVVLLVILVSLALIVAFAVMDSTALLKAFSNAASQL